MAFGPHLKCNIVLKKLKDGNKDRVGKYLTPQEKRDLILAGKNVPTHIFDGEKEYTLR